MSDRDKFVQVAEQVIDTVFQVKNVYDEFMKPINELRRKMHQVELIRQKRFWLGTTYTEDKREQEIIDSI